LYRVNENYNTFTFISCQLHPVGLSAGMKATRQTRNDSRETQNYDLCAHGISHCEYTMGQNTYNFLKFMTYIHNDVGRHSVYQTECLSFYQK